MERRTWSQSFKGDLLCNREGNLVIHWLKRSTRGNAIKFLNLMCFLMVGLLTSQSKTFLWFMILIRHYTCSYVEHTYNLPSLLFSAPLWKSYLLCIMALWLQRTEMSLNLFKEISAFIESCTLSTRRRC